MYVRYTNSLWIYVCHTFMYICLRIVSVYKEERMKQDLIWAWSSTSKHRETTWKHLVCIHMVTWICTNFANRHTDLLARVIDWCCFYYFVENSLVALLEALCARILVFVMTLNVFARVRCDSFNKQSLFRQDVETTYSSASQTPSAWHDSHANKVRGYCNRLQRTVCSSVLQCVAACYTCEQNACDMAHA